MAESSTAEPAETSEPTPTVPKINFVIPLKNRGKFIKLLLTNIQEIVTATSETNIQVWIGDFGSTDIVLSKYTKKFSYPIKVVLFSGIFRIGMSLQSTAEHIHNPNEIIYFCDADSVFPVDICARIRSGTIKNVQFYVPMVSRQLQADGPIVSSEVAKHGGKGNLGVYVEDFVSSGGWGIGFFHQDATTAKTTTTTAKTTTTTTIAKTHANGVETGNPLMRKQWGKHDEHIFHLLWIGMGLIPHRPQETDQWIRWHPRQMGWGK